MHIYIYTLYMCRYMYIHLCIYIYIHIYVCIQDLQAQLLALLSLQVLRALGSIQQSTSQGSQNLYPTSIPHLYVLIFTHTYIYRKICSFRRTYLYVSVLYIYRHVYLRYFFCNWAHHCMYDCTYVRMCVCMHRIYVSMKVCMYACMYV